MTSALLGLTTSCGGASIAPRRGVYASGGTGFVFGITRESFAHRSSTVVGAGAELRGALGYAPANGLALALEGRALIHGGSVSTSVGDRDPALTAVGGVLEWYPEPLAPLHLQLGFARMAASLLGGTSSTGVEDGGGAQNAEPTADDSSGFSGPFAHVGGGWAWRDRHGAALTPRVDVYRGRATNDSASLDLYGLTLDLMVTWL